MAIGCLRDRREVAVVADRPQRAADRGVDGCRRSPGRHRAPRRPPRRTTRSRGSGRPSARLSRESSESGRNRLQARSIAASSSSRTRRARSRRARLGYEEQTRSFPSAGKELPGDLAHDPPETTGGAGGGGRRGERCLRGGRDARRGCSGAERRLPPSDDRRAWNSRPSAGTDAHEADDVARLGLGDQAGEDADSARARDDEPAAKPAEEREAGVAGRCRDADSGEASGSMPGCSGPNLRSGSCRRMRKPLRSHAVAKSILIDSLRRALTSSRRGSCRGAGRRGTRSSAAHRRRGSQAPTRRSRRRRPRAGRVAACSPPWRAPRREDARRHRARAPSARPTRSRLVAKRLAGPAAGAGLRRGRRPDRRRLLVLGGL